MKNLVLVMILALFVGCGDASSEQDLYSSLDNVISGSDTEVFFIGYYQTDDLATRDIAVQNMETFDVTVYAVAGCSINDKVNLGNIQIGQSKMLDTQVNGYGQEYTEFLFESNQILTVYDGYLVNFIYAKTGTLESDINDFISNLGRCSVI